MKLKFQFLKYLVNKDKILLKVYFVKIYFRKYKYVINFYQQDHLKHFQFQTQLIF